MTQEDKDLLFKDLSARLPYGVKASTKVGGDITISFITPYLFPLSSMTKEQGNIKEEFLYDGRYGMNGECMLFPSKDKTTWEGFVPPCKFKDGDILYIDCTGDECSYKHNKYIFILKEISDGKIYCYCYIDEVNKYKKFNISWLSDMTYTPRFATEEEKQKLFDAIKENGYKWNAETKTLEKLIKPKFNVGDRIKKNKDRISYTIIGFNDDGFYKTEYQGGRISYVNFEHQDEWELVPDEIEPNFKDGDIISDPLFNTICIFKREGNHSGTVDFYCGRDYIGNLVIKDSNKPDSHFGNIVDYKLATEEEKQKLFDAIGVNGLKWNAETKTLEKSTIPKYKFRRSRTANDLIEQFRKTPVNTLDIPIVVDDKEVGDVQFVYDENRKKYVFNFLLKDK